MSENYNPDHYSGYDIEPLDFIRENNIDFLRGNVIKYLARHEYKNKLEDIQKAYVYFMQHVAFCYGKEEVEELLKIDWNVTKYFK